MRRKNKRFLSPLLPCKIPSAKKTASWTQVKRTLPGCKCKHKKSKNYDHTLAQWDAQGQLLPKNDTVSSRTSHQIFCKTPWNRSSFKLYSIWSGPSARDNVWACNHHRWPLSALDWFVSLVLFWPNLLLEKVKSFGNRYRV